MRLLAVASLAALLCPAPAMAQVEPADVASAFLEAMLRGDVAALRSQHTADAVVVVGDVGGPLTGVEASLIRPEMKLCTVGPLALDPNEVTADLLGPQTPASLKEMGASAVEGTISCPTKSGEIRKSAVRIVVAGGKVAVFALN